MAKKKIPAYDWKAFDERTRMIDEYIAKLSRRIEKKQAEQKG